MVAECRFAEWAQLSVAPIYATATGKPDFRLARWGVEVKGYAFDPKRPQRSCSLLVRTESANAYPSDLYVLWSVNIETGDHHGVGWATKTEVITSPVGVVSSYTNYENYIRPAGRLRPMGTLLPYVSGLTEHRTLPDGRRLDVQWWVSRTSAALRLDGQARGIVYPGAAGWFWTDHPVPGTVFPDFGAAVACAVEAIAHEHTVSRRDQDSARVGD